MKRRRGHAYYGRRRRVPYAETEAGQREAAGQAKLAAYRAERDALTAGLVRYSEDDIRAKGIAVPPRRDGAWAIVASAVDPRTGEPRAHLFRIAGFGYYEDQGFGGTYFVGGV